MTGKSVFAEQGFETKENITRIFNQKQAKRLALTSSKCQMCFNLKGKGL
ncbi:hypothetical protein NY10_7 [Carnobacterium antarcticum]|nr:hypothetical protein NY10_7 [Carnobacterium sp. CP1]